MTLTQIAINTQEEVIKKLANIYITSDSGNSYPCYYKLYKNGKSKVIYYTDGWGGSGYQPYKLTKDITRHFLESFTDDKNNVDKCYDGKIDFRVYKECLRRFTRDGKVATLIKDL